MIALNIGCGIYIYLMSHLNGTHIVAIAPLFELNKSLHNARFAPKLSEIPKRAYNDLVSYVMPVRGPSSARNDLPGAARRMKGIIAMFRSLALSVNEDEGELGEIGQRRTYLGPAGHTSHVAHVVETHDVYDSERETHQHADKRAPQCCCASQRIILRVLDLKYS